MANTRLIARRIHTVRGLAQVTKAMQMVSASRMRKAQERALAARPYAEKTQELLSHLAHIGDASGINPLLTARPVRRIALVVIASDRGLCGGYNHNVLRRTREYAAQRNVPVAYIAVGRKAREAVMRWRGDLLAEFENLPSDLTLSYASPIARTIEDAFIGGEVDAASIAYTQYVNTVVQKPKIREMLPIVTLEEPTEAKGDETGERAVVDYIYEPSAADILNRLLPHSIEVEMLGCLLESLASEHSARMVAMQAATDNAEEMVDQLVLTYNRARQSAITSELVDIASAAEALTEQS